MAIRFTKAEGRRLGLREGDEVTIPLPSARRLDVSHFHTFADGEGADQHDRILGEALEEEMKRWGDRLYEA
jgi:hypothetical protein